MRKGRLSCGRTMSNFKRPQLPSANRKQRKLLPQDENACSRHTKCNYRCDVSCENDVACRLISWIHRNDQWVLDSRSNDSASVGWAVSMNLVRHLYNKYKTKICLLSCRLYVHQCVLALIVCIAVASFTFRSSILLFNLR